MNLSNYARLLKWQKTFKPVVSGFAYRQENNLRDLTMKLNKIGGGSSNDQDHGTKVSPDWDI